MILTLGNTRTPSFVTVDPRIKNWFISCSDAPTLHLEFDEEDFGSYGVVVEYAKQLSKQLGGVFVHASADHLFIILSELKDRGEFLKIN